jgi:hypothetical protein
MSADTSHGGQNHSGATGPAAPSPADGTPSPRGLTITIPRYRVVDAVTVPIGTASRMLSATRGLPVYAAIGGRAAIDVITWPVAVVAGAG